MLFNSYSFLLLFLPVTLLVYVLAARTVGRGAAFSWLVLASLFFYGWWRWFNLALLLGSLVFNYTAGTWLGRLEQRRPARVVLGLALAFNLGFLGYFKYANFFVENLNDVFKTGWGWAEIALPLGISFYTFQKVAYLVDSYQGRTRGYGFRDFCLFVSFFPQLIAGPITHHGEIMPQFRNRDPAKVSWDDWSVGWTLFVFGLAKKVLIADRLAEFATPVFRVAQQGGHLGLTEAWVGVLAYTLQLYFDFSGYSDMAIGLARLFGLRLPMNFNSPYQATNIADFWRRWHITLSRFLREYLYIPLGGNRHGPARKYLNLFLTMLVGGFWHGAGWTFVLWGALHGFYLLVYHAWRDWRGERVQAPPGRLGLFGARAVTFLAVMFAWVFFRASSLAAAKTLLLGLVGGHGFHSNLARISVVNGLIYATVFLFVVWFLPNTNQLLARFGPTLEYEGEGEPARRPGPPARLTWAPRPVWMLIVVALAVCSVVGLSRVSEFIYWQF